MLASAANATFCKRWNPLGDMKKTIHLGINLCLAKRGVNVHTRCSLNTPKEKTTYSHSHNTLRQQSVKLHIIKSKKGTKVQKYKSVSGKSRTRFMWVYLLTCVGSILFAAPVLLRPNSDRAKKRKSAV